MNISSVSIERPVLATVMSIVILVFGVIGFTFLGVRELPVTDPPIVTVTTNYTGANADIIESQITEPLEESINGISGIRSLNSVSSDGRSTITVEFSLSVDIEAATNDVRDRVSRAVRNLPQDADPPVVAKSDADASPIVSITVQSPNRNLLDLTDLANTMFKERLQTIPGVSEVRIWGEKKYSMKLLIDPTKLAAYGLTPLDVRTALNRENIELPAGRVEGFRTELTIRTLGRLTSQEEFNDLIIKETEGSTVRLRDIGRAELLPENERTILRGNGKRAMVGVAVTPQPGANYIDIANAVYAKVDQIRTDLPADIELGVALDATRPIRNAIEEVEETILISFGLVVVIIFLFLRDWRTTLIPVLAIPISLIGSFFIMYIADFSINVLTLLGIVLATGLVVDDAIVVLENIYAKIERGENPLKAAHEGSSEIYFAIISTTVTLVAVFLPIVFLEGTTGKLFREFGVVVAGSVIISAFVSLTLTPMMSAKLLRHSTDEGWLFRITEPFFVWLTRAYRASLDVVMRHRWIALVSMLASGAAIWYTGTVLQTELAPLDDKSRVRVVATAPEGVSYEMMDAYMKDLLNRIDTIEGKQALIAVTSPGFGASVSVNSGFSWISLVPPTERNYTQQELADRLTQELRRMPFARAFVVQEQTIQVGRGGGLPVQYVIQAPSFEKLKEMLPTFVEKAQQSPVFSVVDLNLKFNKPELAVTIDRDRARALGVSVSDIAQTLQLYFSGQRFGYFIFKGKQYQVIGQALREDRSAPLDMSSVYVRNDRGELVQLDNLVAVAEQSSPPQLYRTNRYVSATVSANLSPGYTLGDGINTMDAIKAEVLDASFSTTLDGASKEFAESSSSLLFAFGFALLLIYLVLAAQFESFRDPLTIMLTVPLAVAGAMISLWLTDQTLNIFSEIGIIVLVGLVTKNGILIVEFANQKREEGYSLTEAVADASEQRLRPILMTSLASILGAAPIAFAIGAASKSRMPMGIALIGGLMYSLILTLYVVPAMYTWIASKKKKTTPASAEVAQETAHA